MSIDLEPCLLDRVSDIPREHVPDCVVWAFGSRVGRHSKPFSDLDLVVISTTELPARRLALLAYAFEDSDLPTGPTNASSRAEHGAGRSGRPPGSPSTDLGAGYARSPKSKGESKGAGNENRLATAGFSAIVIQGERKSPLKSGRDPPMLSPSKAWGGVLNGLLN